MRAVNLLPVKDRPRTAGTVQGRGSYVVLGVLGALLLAVLAYVVTSNQITSREDAIARAQNEQREAEARAAALASYADFAAVKQARLSAVKSLATQRFDWERFSRELAHLLPAGVSLTGVEALLTPDATSGSTAPASSGSEQKDARPSAKLSGCARDHEEVATTLVRLRRLDRAEDVDLNESASRDEDSAGVSSSSGTQAECGSKQPYTWVATVKFSVAAPTEGDDAKVPASLGGGS
jgi:Tfp pilus assembly protein PilN